LPRQITADKSMRDQSEDITDAARECDVSDSSNAHNPHQRFVLGIVGLILGVVALGLASIPSLTLHRDVPEPFGKKEAKKADARMPAEREGGITLKYKNFSVNFGGKVPQKESDKEKAGEPEHVFTRDPIRWFTISAISCALAGIIVASIAQVREKHTGLAIVSMSCCAAAIAWHYLMIGIAVGAAAAAFLILLAIFAEIFH
jgi:hypothetical protein